MRIHTWPEEEQEILDAEDSELEDLEDSEDDLIGGTGAAQAMCGA